MNLAYGPLNDQHTLTNNSSVTRATPEKHVKILKQEMSKQIVTIISIVLLKLTTCEILKMETVYNKPKWERNNKVNKGVWIKNKFKDTLSERSSPGEFIFRPNSLEVDNILQSNYYSFDNVESDETPVFSNYITRSKRSVESTEKRRINIKTKCYDTKSNCKNGITQDKSPSKLLTKIKPASVFNDYPYQVAVIIDDIKNEGIFDKEASDKESIYNIFKDLGTSSDNEINNVLTNENATTKGTKYDKNSKSETRILKMEEVNTTYDFVDGFKVNRNIFDSNNDKEWRPKQGVGASTFKIMPKGQNRTHKPITERGLIKVLSMLTKTFRKIMKQHDNIKRIHDKLLGVNEEFLQKATVISEKFQDFDMKYLYLTNSIEKLKLLEGKMNAQEDYFRNKEQELTKNMVDFEDKQKKFLMQQEQFYNIQKLMLAQNEKINMKQNIIAKTQSEISYKQNNFARFLKKAKQLYMENNRKIPNKSKTNIGTSKGKLHEIKTEYKERFVQKTTPRSQEPQSMKVNLLSLPIDTRIENKDEEIIKEKDYQQVDDLIYKHYFNNTFIDYLMKNKVLTNYGDTDSNDKIRSTTKNKRGNNIHDENTKLYPVNKLENITIEFPETNLHRERRWINHHSNRKSKRKHRGKVQSKEPFVDDSKPIRSRSKTELHVDPIKDEKIQNNDGHDTKNDPFVAMATNFCKEIGQSANEQMLKWCVEKALRRLKVIDLKLTPPVPTVKKEPKVSQKIANVTSKTTRTSSLLKSSIPAGLNTIVTSQPSTKATELTTTPLTVATEDIQPFTKFFPDNDELESNLKQYDLKPDTEGNVYFDGSLHVSDLLDSESDELSDVIPNLNSNSKLELDLRPFDAGLRKQYMMRLLNARRKKT